MSSFSRRSIVATTIHRISEPAPEASQSAETQEDGTIRSADPSIPPVEAHPAAGEVDFDIAIAEVLMTLATGSGADDARPGTELEGAAAPAQIEGEDDPVLGEAVTSDGEEDEPGDEDESSDPEAILAAEAATFRLLGELERLWHRAA